MIVPKPKHEDYRGFNGDVDYVVGKCFFERSVAIAAVEAIEKHIKVANYSADLYKVLDEIKASGWTR